MVHAYPHLLSPLWLPRATLVNRVVMGAMHTTIERLDRSIERIHAFYRARAVGGVALIITGAHSPSEEGRVDERSPVFVRDHDVAWHRATVDAVRGTPTLMCLQLLHAGRYARLPECVAPSAIKSRINRFTPRALTTSEVWRVVEDFAQAAKTARDLGYHGVEIMGSEGYLLNEFTAPFTNQRSDEFGGDVEGRLRLPVEVVRATRRSIGADALIVYRLSGLDLVDTGTTGDETLELARRIQEAGADVLNIGVGWHESMVPTIAHVVPRAAWAFAARRVRQVVSIPVVASNRINDPQVAEDLISAGDADLVSMARPMLSDPDFVRKAAAAEPHRINTCIACNQSCLDGYFTRRGVSCLVNPRAGRELDFAEAAPWITRKVGVVGGGPAGMTFAFNAAERGHQVTLYEATERLGGQLQMARAIPSKTEFDQALRYFSQRLVDTGVTVRLGHAPTAAELVAVGYDEVVIATGVRPRRLDLPGIDRPHVLDYIDVLLHRRSVGTRVAIIGAGGIGHDVAEFLAGAEPHVAPRSADFNEEYAVDASLRAPGGLLGPPRPVPPRRSITLLQRRLGLVGASLGVSTGWILRDRLRRLGVETIAGVTYERITEEGVLVRVGDEPRLVRADTIVVCAGQQSERSLADELRSLAPALPVHVVGGADVAEELDAARAIEQATRLAVRIGTHPAGGNAKLREEGLS